MTVKVEIQDNHAYLTMPEGDGVVRIDLGVVLRNSNENLERVIVRAFMNGMEHQNRKIRELIGAK